MADRLEERISTLAKKYRKMAPEKTPLEIIRGDNKKLKEKWAVRTLFYYLDPHKEHGLDSDLLEYFLNAIDENVDYNPSELNHVQIKQEAVSEDNKRPDALLWINEASKQKFFICFEVKIERKEEDDVDGMYQTVKYAKTDNFSWPELEIKSIPDENSYYIYIKKKNKHPDEPESNYFNRTSWEWIADSLQNWLNDVKRKGDIEYPIQTLVQIDMFIKSIRRRICDSDNENRSDLAELYVEYFEEISEVEDAR